MNNTVSIVIRTMPHRYNFLDKCLFVLSNQTYDDLEVIIVCQQTNNNTDLRMVESLLARWSVFFQRKIKFIHHHADHDARSKSLNLGLSNFSGRYLSFLDDDDKVYPDHITTCVSRLKDDSAVWCYTDCEVAYYNENKQLFLRSNPFRRNYYSFLDHLTRNFIPIHSFVIDTYRMEKLHYFNENLSKHEDYDFLLQLAHKYRPLHISVETVQYCVREDGSNTIISINEDEIIMKRKQKEWRESNDAIKNLKIAHFGWWVAEFETVSYQREDIFFYRNLVDDYYNSISLRLMRVVRRLFYKIIKGWSCPPNIVPESEQEARAIVESILTSLSWEITAPIRVMSRFVAFFKKKSGR